MINKKAAPIKLFFGMPTPKQLRRIHSGIYFAIDAEAVAPKDSYTLKAINGKIMSYDTFCHENKLFTSMEIASHVLGIRPYHKSLSPNIRHWTNIDD